MRARRTRGETVTGLRPCATAAAGPALMPLLFLVSAAVPPMRPGLPHSRMISFPVTEMLSVGSALVAGPWTTLPSLTLNSLPWHGQSIVPLATWSTMHCMCVQTALKALTWPASGWVTTIRGPLKIFPPPTGMSVVAARMFFPLAPALPVLVLPVLAAPVLALVPLVLAPPEAGRADPAAELELAELQALRAAMPAMPIPARPALASTPRRVACACPASGSGW